MTKGDKPVAGDNDVGRRVRVARISAGLTRTELAKRLGVSFNTIERSETGRREISLDELVRIAEVCSVPEPFMRYGWAALSDERRFDQLTQAIERIGEAIVERTDRERQDD
jgi:transcriptional regulator with XRE-family HTH domain